MSKVDHLFIVGAGFSHYAGLPLTSDFTKKLIDVAELKKTGPSAMIVRFLQKFVQDTFDQTDHAAPEIWPHLEDIFTCVDLSANTGHHLGPNYSPSDLRAIRRGLIVRIIRMLRQNYNKAQTLRTEDWRVLERLFLMVVPEKCAFIAMNWDTVIEEGMEQAQNVKAFDYGCDAQFAKFEGATLEPTTPRSKKTIQVLKVHGSANWLYCDTCRTTFWVNPKNTSRVAKELFRERDWRIVKKHVGGDYPHGKDSTLICGACSARSLGTRFATFSYRKALDFPMYERSWLTVERLLRDAKTWTFIGYSLPPADYEFKHLLKRVQLSRREPPKLVLISGGNEAPSTQSNYEKFFGSHLGQFEGSYFEYGLNSNAINHLKSIGALTDKAVKL